MKIEVIYGGAGTGKTHLLLQRINSLTTNNYIVLAPTHTAVRNLSGRSTIDINKFATIYSYFRIDYENDDVIGAIKNYNYIFIDEFGLIKKELFRKIINWLERNNRDVTVIIAGDVVQLSPIYLEERSIPFQKLRKHYEREFAHVIEHDFNSIFSLSTIRKAEKTLLTKNFRSNNNVLNLIWNIFYEMKTDQINYITVTKAVALILQTGATFISSRYSHHEPIYELMKQQLLITKECKIVNKLVFYEGAQFLIAENTKDYRNGDIVTFSHIINNTVYFKEDKHWNGEFKLLPLQLLTAHKSQGLSIENVIVCVDDMFDPCMFYTMCTRTISHLYFFKYKDVDLQPYLEQFHQLLEYYKYI